MRTLFYSAIALGAVVAASGTASAECTTVIVDGKPQVICSPPPPPPPGTGCGVFCKPKPTK